jgi:FAD/FMN-containing dehydrogenase
LPVGDGDVPGFPLPIENPARKKGVTFLLGRRSNAMGAVAFLALAMCLRPVLFLSSVAFREARFVPGILPVGWTGDASGLDDAPVAGVVRVPRDPAGAEKTIRHALEDARARGLPVSIAGARHTQGGQTFVRDGIVLDMLDMDGMSFDAAANVLTVQAGARWAEILPFLNRRGRSVAVMQSDNIFTVGGSLSVNVHGWQHDKPPIACSVRSLRVMTADGRVLRASRTENPDLFAGVLGGYGLLGVILEASLETVPDEGYVIRRRIIPSEEYVTVYARALGEDPAVGLLFGRLCVAPDRFLKEAVLTSFHRAPAPPSDLLPRPRWPFLKRVIFRGSVGSAYGKRLRWRMEKVFGRWLEPRRLRRNAALNQTPDDFLNRDPSRTDILHEYFIPPENVNAFIARLREIVPRRGGDLLNVTVRTVRRDGDSLLRYADRDVFAFVLLFNQERTPAADERMTAMTQELIDAALDLGGRYYLPYRPHATTDQFRRAYPGADSFRKLKKRYDKDEVWQNNFYRTYLRGNE